MKKYLNVFCNGCLGNNIIKRNREFAWMDENVLLANCYVNEKFTLCFRDQLIENIYLFGKHKKRPGGKLFYVALENTVDWSVEYWSREYCNLMFTDASNFLFKFKNFYCCVTAKAMENFAIQGGDVENLQNVIPITDYSESEEEDKSKIGPVKFPRWMIYNGQVKCNYCTLCGHEQKDCCLYFADKQMGLLKAELNENKGYEYKPNNSNAKNKKQTSLADNIKRTIPITDKIEAKINSSTEIKINLSTQSNPEKGSYKSKQYTKQTNEFKQYGNK